jgi:hypothetical protein
MNTKHLVAATLLALTAGLVLVPACSSSNTNTCAIGKEGCPCTTGGACDPGLLCLSAHCVLLEGGLPTTTGTATTTGTGTATGATTSTGSVTAGSGGAAGSVLTGAGGSTATGGATGSGGGTTTGGGPPPDAGPTSDLGKACAAPADCTGGLTCVRTSDSTWLNQGGPAHGYCSIACVNQATCAPRGGVCVDMSFLVTDPPNPWCLQACTFGGGSSTNAAARAAKCHGRTDVACVQGAATDAGLPPAFCEPICSQDSDCAGGRRCDPASSVCVSTTPTGAALGTKCTPTADTCAGACVPLTNASYCTQPCVIGPLSIPQCNHTAGALGAGGAHGLCGLSSATAESGDIGYCTQECETVADCSDRTDPGGTCDTSIKPAAGHGICSWP